MNKGRPLILITRPEAEARQLADKLEQEGYDTVCTPMLTFRTLDFKQPDLSAYRGLIFTSAHGVRVLAEVTDLRSIAVFAVGRQTAAEAHGAGFEEVVSADGAAADLVKMIEAAAEDQAGPWLHVRGRDAALSVKDELQAAGIPADEIIVYAADQADHFSPEALDALRGDKIDAVMFFSKRTAENFLRLVDENGLEPHLRRIKALSISPAVLECVQAERWAETYTSSRPERDAMQEILRKACA